VRKSHRLVEILLRIASFSGRNIHGDREDSPVGKNSVLDKRKSYYGNPETSSPAARKLVKRARHSLIPLDLPDSMKVIKDFLTTSDEAYMNKAFLGLFTSEDLTRILFAGHRGYSR
jgi:hypothetical protein